MGFECGEKHHPDYALEEDSSREYSGRSVLVQMGFEGGETHRPDFALEEDSSRAYSGRFSTYGRTSLRCFWWNIRFRMRGVEQHIVFWCKKQVSHERGWTKCCFSMKTQVSHERGRTKCCFSNLKEQVSHERGRKQVVSLKFSVSELSEEPNI